MLNEGQEGGGVLGSMVAVLIQPQAFSTVFGVEMALAAGCSCSDFLFMTIYWTIYCTWTGVEFFCRF